MSTIINIEKPLITVFTPLYNRINTLKRTYESMCRQTSKNFVWMIIDDGSTDNPYDTIKEWLKKDDGFEIKSLDSYETLSKNLVLGLSLDVEKFWN